MTFEQLISLAKPVEVSGPQPEELTVLAQDSRKVTAGAAFIAVKGLRVDGHDYIEDAVARGAKAIIAERPVEADEVCVVRVDNSRRLLGPLAQAFAGYPAEMMQLIGITGTNGKTTVATLVYQVLEQLAGKPSMLGTVNKRIRDEEVESRMTTADPVELAADMARMVEAGTRHLVMEVSSHALDQQRTRGLDFNVAAFTNLSHDHLDYHKGFESYAAAKKALFDGLTSESVAVINADDEQSEFMVQDCKAGLVTFGFEKEASYSCDILSSGVNGLRINIEGRILETPLLGRYNAYNVVQAFLICSRLGFDEGRIIDALQHASGAEGRLEPVEGSGEGNPVILVDYAHTPNALENVIKALQEVSEGKSELHVIFGCGGDRDRAKRPVMAHIAERYADRVTVTSDNPRSEDPDLIIDDIMEGFAVPEKVQRITDRKEAIKKKVATVSAEAMVLIAGKGHETYQEVNGKRHEFDDRRIAHEVLVRRRRNLKNDGVG